MDLQFTLYLFRRFKLLKWWSQSFLVGTKELLCGWRNDDGVVTSLETFMIKDIPKAASDWKPNVCVNFLSSLLSKLKSSITEESSVHTVTWNSRSKQIQVLNHIVHGSWELLLTARYQNRHHCLRNTFHHGT